MIQRRLFDSEREELLKVRGMKLSAEKNAEDLELVRAAAEMVYRRDGSSDIERARRYLKDKGIKIVSGNWMGSVFRGWIPTGRFVKARHKGGHNRLVRVWTK